MSGFNANFRNAHDGSQSTFDGAANQRGSANPPNVPPVLLPFLTLECGDTLTDIVLAKQVGFSFFRTENVIENTKYNARQANFVCDASQPIDIQVTARGFTPYVTLARSAEYIVRAADGSGIIMATPGEEFTGPFTIEVTSVEPYATGDFDITLGCSLVPFTLAVDKVTINQGQKLIFTVSTDDLITWPPGSSGYVINTLAPSDVTQIFHFVTDGSGNATVEGWVRALRDTLFVVSNFGMGLGDLSNRMTVTVTAAPSAVDFTSLVSVFNDWIALVLSSPTTMNTVGAGGYNSYTGSRTATDPFTADSTATTVGDTANGGAPNLLSFGFDDRPQGGSSFFTAQYTKDDDVNGVHYPLGNYTRDTYSGNGGFIPPSTLIIT